ncbi:TPA: hypothetical protein EYN98_16155 [Candidatus Poribacteria bacterium]|nr:hypothetical protein [Candidatus Poribacteria bacterium]HIA67555.1 hypothetical protein [Candidatus Poribacteria bacterium]HIB86285.1 hypothetical protein [Candidatus Poribacteria bacterium]HIC01712.1 hypothetical protein [Candidatus Poribacteria bacterium]HIM11909.1 hypothetical protein [Candidatus Poribacteria bacterium]
MLQVEILDPKEIGKAAKVFHRDGFVVIQNALTASQLVTAQSGAERVITQQMEQIPLDQANRGYARYSFGSQVHHLEWAQLIDNPSILPILEAIWNSSDFVCSGVGGDYSTPGAEIQSLHSDLGDFFNDSLGLVTVKDVPTPFIVVNYLMVEFTQMNGATRFVPGTHRTRTPIPTLEEEPERLKQSFICAPAGTAIVRDVRCWHGGTSNNSDQIRPMLGVGYFAPWYRDSRLQPHLPLQLYQTLSDRTQNLARFLVKR